MPCCCKICIFSQTNGKKAFMNNGKALWKPWDDIHILVINIVNKIDQVFMEITKFRDIIEIVIFLQKSITHDGIRSYTVIYYLIVPKHLSQVLYIISWLPEWFSFVHKCLFSISRYLNRWLRWGKKKSPKSTEDNVYSTSFILSFFKIALIPSQNLTRYISPAKEKGTNSLELKYYFYTLCLVFIALYCLEWH